MGDSSLSGKLIHLALDIFGYGTYIAIMHILEAVSIGDFLNNSDWRGIDHIKLCRMIAQLYKTIKYQCIIVKRAQFCDKTLAAAKALWYLGLMNLHHLLCHLIKSQFLCYKLHHLAMGNLAEESSVKTCSIWH